MKKLLIIGIIILAIFLLYKYVIQDPIQLQFECGKTALDTYTKRFEAIDADPKQTAGKVNDGIISEITRLKLLEQQRQDAEKCLQDKSIWF